MHLLHMIIKYGRRVTEVKKAAAIILLILLLSGCVDNNLISYDTKSEESDTVTQQSTGKPEGINYRDKTLAQIMPGFPEDLVQGIDKNQLNTIARYYYYPDNFAIRMTGEIRDTHYSITYYPDDKQVAYDQFMTSLGGSPDKDPNEFNVTIDKYYINVKANPYGDIINIDCYTNTGEEFFDSALDEVCDRCMPSGINLVLLSKGLSVREDSKSYTFEYSYEGDETAILEFYRTLIPNCKEETRNEAVYIEDSIVGMELGQFVTIFTEYNKVMYHEVTYQEE